ncbi:AbgT family transporter [Sediminivirga luteola]|uniref:p-aminobenzoyl-glutamate transporter n=1 Tax=Sediminivirga luteola TaxID=1774748 RepID=A0A8J2U0J1_9MICO|nr:AbgT family transporter [Sediminivirga luteola]MCI2265330.1 AbgT family transporter [Sediminivirga luteola]GGA24791.1 p-aminobenzoyl-glutamate transporter [Sediminivirga luteola]
MSTSTPAGSRQPGSGGDPAGRPGIGARMLDAVERVGNKLPEPFTLFLGLFLITGLLSTGLALGGVQVAIPGGEGEIVEIKGLFTGEGLAWLTTSMGDNYLGFPPLATVLPILLAVGVAEKTGMLAALVRSAFGRAPRWLLPYVVAFVGVIGSVMADSAFVLIPPLAALVFKAAGRHPVAGLLGGFGAAGAGYSTSVVPTSLDALFAGITTAVMETLPGYEYSAVNPVSNYFFNVVAALVLTVIAGFIIDRVLEPQLLRAGTPRDQTTAEGEQVHQELSPTLEPGEKRGLWLSLGAAAALAAVFVAAVLVPGSPWRNEDGGFLPSSPLLSSIVFLVFAFFMTMGVVYGLAVGTIRSMNDVVRMMGEAITDMLSFLVLAFILGQFIALFNWSGIGSWIAVNGAAGLESMELTGFGVVLGFIVLASVLNLFIISGSSLWTIMAAVFVPLFALLGYEPAFIQAAFRVGDSATQVITPLNPYMIVILGLLRRYEPQAGVGTVAARMLPFVIPFWLAWAGLLALWFFLDLPLGPGNGIFLE